MFDFIKKALFLFGDGFLDIGMTVILLLVIIYYSGLLIINILKVALFILKGIVSWAKNGFKIHINIDFKELFYCGYNGLGAILLMILFVGLVFGAIWIVGWIASFILNLI